MKESDQFWYKALFIVVILTLLVFFLRDVLLKIFG